VSVPSTVVALQPLKLRGNATTRRLASTLRGAGPRRLGGYLFRVEVLFEDVLGQEDPVVELALAGKVRPFV